MLGGRSRNLFIRLFEGEIINRLIRKKRFLFSLSFVCCLYLWLKLKLESQTQSCGERVINRAHPTPLPGIIPLLGVAHKRGRTDEGGN